MPLKTIFWLSLVNLGCVHLMAQPAAPARLVGYQLSTCDNRIYPERLLSRIVQQQWHQDTLYLTLGSLYLTCDGLADSLQTSLQHDTLYLREWFQPQIADTIRQGDSLLFVYEPREEPNCGCCFEITFLLTDIGIQPSRVWLDGQFLQYHPVGYKYTPTIPSFSLVHGDTVNRTDQWGWKQGRWISAASDSSISSGRYLDGTEVTECILVLAANSLHVVFVLPDQQGNPRGSAAVFGLNGELLKNKDLAPPIIAFIQRWLQENPPATQRDALFRLWQALDAVGL